jgi:hypothetical protein
VDALKLKNKERIAVLLILYGIKESDKKTKPILVEVLGGLIKSNWDALRQLREAFKQKSKIWWINVLKGRLSIR